MKTSFLSATAFATLIGFGATAALAQQTAPTLNAPAVQKSAPVESGKTATGAPADAKAKRDSAAKTTDGTARREAARACASVKDKAAHATCLTNHAKAPAGKADQKAATPDKTKSAPRTGG